MKNIAKLITNRLPRLKVSFDKLTKKEVLVGYPQDRAVERKQDPDQPRSPMNNATLAYIHDNGSPAANIPARPFMKPGIEAASVRIVAQFKIAAARAIHADDSAVEQGLNKAGLIAQASVRNTINEGIPPPLVESTLAARRRRGRMGTKQLVDTGQLRNAVNYVIREKS